MFYQCISNYLRESKFLDRVIEEHSKANYKERFTTHKWMNEWVWSWSSLRSSKIVSGGIIICEDPPSTPALYGALLAMEKFLNTEEGKNYVKIFKGSQYFLLRK